jgi:hypothetical protein
MKKGQISVELIIISSVLLVMFILLLNVVSTRNNVSLALTQQFSVEELGYKISSSINEVYLAGDRTNKTIFLPETLRSNTNYSLNLNPSIRNIRLDYDDKRLDFPLLTSNITGDFILNSNNQIFNNKGLIEIE